MILVSDRSDENSDLYRQLSAIAPCQLVPLHLMQVQAKGQIVICECNLDNFGTARILRQGLRRSETDEDPLIFVVDGTSYHQTKQAWALGATDVVASGQTQDVIDLLFSRYREQLCANPEHVSAALQAGLAVVDLLTPAVLECGYPNATVEVGAEAILDSISSDGLGSWLGTIWKYDDLTYQHCLLVGGTASAFATELGFSRSDRMLVTTAALVHDLGKAFVPREILNKSGPLNRDERAIVARHPQLGHQVLRNHGIDNQNLLDPILSHHELLDGSGYPNQLRAPAIGDLTRIVTISDIFSALVERRSYKPPRSVQSALAEMQTMEGKLDPDLLRAFGGLVVNGALAA